MNIYLKTKPPIMGAVDYPEGDGKPMAESDLHREIMFYIIHLLQRFFAGQQVYVSGNLLVYFEKGNPRKSVAPDCFVVRAIEPHRRPIYKIWEETKGPEVVFEISSKTTQREDLNPKMRLYAQLGVQEYFIYDPTSDYLDPPLVGFVLTSAGYTPMQPLTGPYSTNPAPQYVSQVLGLQLVLDDEKRLQFFQLATGERLLTDDEARQRADDARQQAQEAYQQADDARLQAQEAYHQADNARLQAQEARHQADNARQQAEQLASQAVMRATDAESRAAEAEAENTRLRAELARLRGEN